MKKTYYSGIVLVALLAVFAGSVAFAQTNTTAPDKSGIWSKLFGPKQEKIDDEKIRLEEQKARIEEQRARITEQRLKMASTTRKIEDRLASSTIKIQEREERRASSTEARRVRLEEKFKTGISNQIAKINDRLSDAIDRIKRTDDRLEEHIAKLKARNINTSTSDALLVIAQARLVTATEKVTALNTSLQGILATNISTTTKNSIRAKTAEANTYVKAAHEAYVKVVESLKPGRNKTATSTLNGQAATTTP